MGGLNQKGKMMKDLWQFNIQIKTWIKIKISINKEESDLSESGLVQHTSSYVKVNYGFDTKKEKEGSEFQEGIYIFGGRNEFADSNNELRMLKLSDNFRSAKLMKVPTKGTPPAARFGHSMEFLANKNTIAIFGGCGNFYSPFYGNLFTLNVEKLCWYQVTITGSLPAERTGHGMISDKENLIIFGGINEEGF